MTHLYFAYGSNLHLRRMQMRVPSARPVARGVVTRRELRFHKRGVDGSAKADAFRTETAGDRVWGVVYEISRREKRRLDDCESLGVGYDESDVQVIVDNQVLSATLYEARPQAIAADLRAFRWYLDYVIAGARAHGCPEWHLQQLERISSCADPDRRRAAWHQTQLNGSGESPVVTAPLFN